MIANQKGMASFYDFPPAKQRLYVILIGIILATIPCYFLGFAAISQAPPVETTTPTGTPEILERSGTPPTPTLTVSGKSPRRWRCY